MFYALHARERQPGLFMKSFPRSRAAFISCVVLLSCLLAAPSGARCERRTLTAGFTGSLPSPESPFAPEWSTAQAVVVMDAVAKIPVTLTALHDGRNVSIRAVFPDPDESREHRTLRWDAAARAYADGPEREDMLALKWSMSGPDTGLTLAEDAPYMADEWCWRACRTDHAGHADDRLQIYSVHPDPYAKAMVSRGGKVFYLTREGDAGTDPGAPALHPGYAGERAAKYELARPTGSRADVSARGFWSAGHWTVTFRRALDTRSPDDVAFDTAEAYAFGVSRFDLAGGPAEPSAHEPLFNCGEVGEVLLLRFETR